MASNPKHENFRPATQEELDRAAEITPSDIDQAVAAWKDDAPPELKDLLDAEELHFDGNAEGDAG